MGMTASSSPSGRAVPQMNVTPLVDVVLVLLIIFMVVAPLLSKTFALHLPKQEESAVPSSSDDSLVLTVHTDGRLLLNRNEISKQELSDKLRRLLAARSDKAIYFDAENGTPYGKAVEAMDLARAGGATTIAILTEKVTP